MPSRSRIVIAVGLPGAGKSTYLSRLGVNAISSDAIRRQFADNESDQTIHARVFATARFLLRQRLAIGRSATWIDATNLTVKERKPWLKIARDHACRIEAIYFDVPLEVCKARNAARGRTVPDEAMDRMAAKLTPPTRAEGFDRITLVTA